MTLQRHQRPSALSPSPRYSVRARRGMAGWASGAALHCVGENLTLSGLFSIRRAESPRYRLPCRAIILTGTPLCIPVFNRRAARRVGGEDTRRTHAGELVRRAVLCLSVRTRSSTVRFMTDTACGDAVHTRRAGTWGTNAPPHQDEFPPQTGRAYSGCPGDATLWFKPQAHRLAHLRRAGYAIHLSELHTETGERIRHVNERMSPLARHNAPGAIRGRFCVRYVSVWVVCDNGICKRTTMSSQPKTTVSNQHTFWCTISSAYSSGASGRSAVRGTAIGVNWRATNAIRRSRSVTLITRSVTSTRQRHQRPAALRPFPRSAVRAGRGMAAAVLRRWSCIVIRR